MSKIIHKYPYTLLCDDFELETEFEVITENLIEEPAPTVKAELKIYDNCPWVNKLMNLYYSGKF